jgi:hypothetical protein
VATFSRRGNSAITISPAANGLLAAALFGALAWRPAGQTIVRDIFIRLLMAIAQ